MCQQLEFKKEFPKEIKQLASKHKIKVFEYDTFYNLLYTLSKYDAELVDKYLTTYLDCNLQTLK